MGPATAIVMGLVGVLVVAGVLVLGGGRRTRNRPSGLCPADGCRCKNQPDAEFCARCGAKLH